MKIRLLILTLLTTCCSSVEQNYFIEKKDLGKTTKGSILYKLFQTGIGNYRYEFYSVDNKDTTELFQANLNDATYEGLRFIIQEAKDTIKIKSNRNLGHLIKKVDDHIFILLRKVDPFQNMAFTVHSGSGKMTRLMVYNDNISTLSELEISIHEKIWDQEEVDVMARDLNAKDINTFTFIQKYPSLNADYYLVKFGQVKEERLPAISFYRVDNKSGRVDKVVE